MVIIGSNNGVTVKLLGVWSHPEPNQHLLCTLACYSHPELENFATVDESLYCVSDDGADTYDVWNLKEGFYIVKSEG